MFLLWLRQLPRCGDQTPASVPPPPEVRSSVTSPGYTPVFPPSSFVVPSFVWFLIFFPSVRYSCMLSAGVLHVLLCLKVYSWYIHGKRFTPCPPTSLPFCLSWSSPYILIGVFLLLFLIPSYMSHLDVLKINLLSAVSFAIIFSILWVVFSFCLWFLYVYISFCLWLCKSF